MVGLLEQYSVNCTLQIDPSFQCGVYPWIYCLANTLGRKNYLSMTIASVLQQIHKKKAKFLDDGQKVLTKDPAKIHN